MHDVAAYRLFSMPPCVCLALPARLRLAPRRPPYVLVPIIDQSSGSFTRSSSHRAEPTEPSTNAILQAKMMVLQMLGSLLKISTITRYASEPGNRLAGGHKNLTSTQ